MSTTLRTEVPTPQDWFYVGGRYVEVDDKTYSTGQMYVEKYMPAGDPKPTPIVMIHGGVQTGTNFIATADGRRGWAGDFVDAGYVVYVVDQPERGRSGHQLVADRTLPMQRYSVEQIERIFTAPATARRWPAADQHSQWPGTGLQGDPLFDRFFLSQVEMLVDRDEIERSNRDAGIALLDEIGEAILLTHSQSGPFGWLLADARPQLVKAILAVEPNGPPFRDISFKGEPDWFAYQPNESRRWGVTRLPLHFDPPIEDPIEFAPEIQSQAMQVSEQRPLVTGMLPTCEQRTLVNLTHIPIAIISAEASYHATYDQCTSEFLRWAGVSHDFIRLESEGIKGNGHMMMLEKNSQQISQLMLEWLNKAHARMSVQP